MMESYGEALTHTRNGASTRARIKTGKLMINKKKPIAISRATMIAEYETMLRGLKKAVEADLAVLAQVNSQGPEDTYSFAAQIWLRDR